MADRTSAALFAEIFTLLASAEPLDRQALVSRFWEMSRWYDFTPHQMGCDDSLTKLGLARLSINSKYPDDGEVMNYGPAKTEGNRA